MSSLGGFIQTGAKSYLNSRINNLLGESGAEDITISLSANGTEIELPVVPESYECSVGNNNETINIINAGEYLMKGKTGLKNITISSFFPAQEYSFLKEDTEINPWGLVEQIEQWRMENETIAFSLSGSTIDFTCLIESFKYGEQDGSGDVYYQIELKEYREIGAEPASKDDTSDLMNRPKLSYLQRAGLNLAKNIIAGQSPVNAVAGALGASGLTKKQKGYLEISKMVFRKGGITRGDVISFDQQGNASVNGVKLGTYDQRSFNPDEWVIH